MRRKIRQLRFVTTYLSDGITDCQQKRAHDEEIGQQIRHRSMVVGRYLPANAQDMSSPRPQTTPLTDSNQSPPPHGTQTPPTEQDPVHDQAPGSPTTPTLQSVIALNFQTSFSISAHSFPHV